MAQVKDLEVMYTNVMNSAFEGVTRIPECVALVEMFTSLAKLDAIRRCVEKKTADVYELFTSQVTNDSILVLFIHYICSYI